MSNIIFNTESLHLEFCKDTGALIALSAIETGWYIIDRPEAGLSWRLMVPIHEELRNNDVLGEKQKLKSKEIRDGEITFVWDNPLSERGRVIDCSITLKVRAEGRQAVYYIDIENRSPYTIENVYCPYLGDVKYPNGAKTFKNFMLSYSAAMQQSIWPEFQNAVGYYGADYPTTITQGPPIRPYYLMRTPDQGLYAGIKAPSSELVAWEMELRPGWDSSINSRVPESGTISGKMVQTRFAALHVPYILSGESRSLTPIALEAYQGGWQKGVDIYKKWQSAWLKLPKLPHWAKEPHSWLQLHINSPEDELRMRFAELPKVAESCKKHGVQAIQLVGWNDGGQDQGNPSHDPDPRLGTFKELKEAIRKCQEIGVKMILFTKFTWSDRATQWFRDELETYATKDPYGDSYVYAGYKYQTGTQLLDINTKRLIPMCLLSEKYLEICQNEFNKVVALGADGMLYDECQHHTPAILCFDETHGHRYGAPVYQNDRELIKRFWTTPGISPDFLMAGEACYDWEMEEYHLAYHRTENKSHIPLSRYMLPNAQYMTAVTGFNDRNMVNQCLMCRYIISYEPYNFKGSLDDFPMTVEYGMKMDALRTEYRKWFWDGEYRDVCGAQVRNESGEEHRTYSVFSAEDGSLGLAVCNYEDYEIAVKCVSEDGKAFTRYRLVDEEALKETDGLITIPSRSAAIVI